MESQNARSLGRAHKVYLCLVAVGVLSAVVGFAPTSVAQIGKLPPAAAKVSLDVVIEHMGRELGG